MPSLACLAELHKAGLDVSAGATRCLVEVHNDLHNCLPFLPVEQPGRYDRWFKHEKLCLCDTFASQVSLETQKSYQCSVPTLLQLPVKLLDCKVGVAFHFTRTLPEG